MLDRLLDPVQRSGLPAADRTQLIDVVAAGLHNAYWLGLLLSVATLVLVCFLPARLKLATPPPDFGSFSGSPSESGVDMAAKCTPKPAKRPGRHP